MKETERTLQVFNNEEFGKVRTLSIDGEPWFVGKDICEAFGDTNYRRSLARLDQEDRTLMEIATDGGVQNMTVVNESGLYSLLFYMQPQKAKGVSQTDTLIKERTIKLKKFKRWVTSEVLPTIRKTGSYGRSNELEEAQAHIDILKKELEFIESIDKINEKLNYLYCMMDDIKDANSVLNSSKPVTYEECVGNSHIITDKKGQINHTVQLLLNTGLFDNRAKLFSKIYRLMSSKRNVDMDKAQLAYSIQNGIDVEYVKPFDVITNVGYVYKAFMEIAGEMVDALHADKPQIVLSKAYTDTKERILSEGYSLFGLYHPLIYKKIYKKMHDEYGVDWKDYDGNGEAVRSDENLQKMFVEAFNMLLCEQ